jgi:hypothetical protein
MQRVYLLRRTHSDTQDLRRAVYSDPQVDLSWAVTCYGIVLMVSKVILIYEAPAQDEHVQGRAATEALVGRHLGWIY